MILISSMFYVDPGSLFLPPDDLVRGNAGGQTKPDWVSKYQKRFAELYDKNKDGKLNEKEIKGWIFPESNEHLIKEADHLIAHSDKNKVKECYRTNSQKT